MTDAIGVAVGRVQLFRTLDQTNELCLKGSQLSDSAVEVGRAAPKQVKHMTAG